MHVSCQHKIQAEYFSLMLYQDVFFKNNSRNGLFTMDLMITVNEYHHMPKEFHRSTHQRNHFDIIALINKNKMLYTQTFIFFQCKNNIFKLNVASLSDFKAFLNDKLWIHLMFSYIWVKLCSYSGCILTLTITSNKDLKSLFNLLWPKDKGLEKVELMIFHDPWETKDSSWAISSSLKARYIHRSYSVRVI